MSRWELRRALDIAQRRYDESANVTEAFKLQLRKRIELNRGTDAVNEAREQVEAAEVKEVLDWQEWNMLRQELAVNGIRLGIARV